VDAVVREFTPKLTDYAVAYYEDPTTMPGELAAFLRNVLLPGPLLLDFERDDIVVEPHCDGRIYKIMTRRDEALIATKSRPDGGRNEVPVYAARVDGALKVVR